MPKYKLHRPRISNNIVVKVELKLTFCKNIILFFLYRKKIFVSIILRYTSIRPKVYHKCKRETVTWVTGT